MLTTLVDRIDLKRNTLEIRIRPSQLPAILRGENGPQNKKRPPDTDEPIITFAIPAR